MNTLKSFFKTIRHYHVSAYAAQSSFFIIVCLVPFFIILFNIIQYTPINRELILQLMLTITPEQLAPLIYNILPDINTYTPITFSTGTIITLWIAGKAFLAISQGLRSIYNTNSSGNYIFRRIMASFYTLVFVIVLIFSITLTIFGNALILAFKETLPAFAIILRELLQHRFLIVSSFLILVFGLLYKFVAGNFAFVHVLPGAVFTAISWQLFSYIYSRYIENSPNFNQLYGRLGIIVFAMLWIYFSISIFFYGAIINVFLNKSGLFQSPNRKT